jgi:hypothetical protein
MANSVGFVVTRENHMARIGWRASMVKRKANSVGFVATRENQVARIGWRASMVKRKGLYALPRSSRLLMNASILMSVGQRKPRGGEQISGRKIAL